MVSAQNKKNIFRNAGWGRFDPLIHRRARLCALISTSAIRGSKLSLNEKFWLLFK